MKAKINVKDCPFCGAKIIVRRGLCDVTFFVCGNMSECGAVVSFCGHHYVSENTTEAADPVAHWNRRAV